MDVSHCHTSSYPASSELVQGTGSALRGPENQPLGAPRDPHLSRLPPAQPASTEPDARPLGDLPALRRRDRLAPAHTDRRARLHRRSIPNSETTTRRMNDESHD